MSNCSFNQDSKKSSSMFLPFILDNVLCMAGFIFLFVHWVVSVVKRTMKVASENKEFLSVLIVTLVTGVSSIFIK